MLFGAGITQRQWSKLNTLKEITSVEPRGNALWIASCPEITSLENLASLETVNGGLVIADMPGLTNLMGLHNIKDLKPAMDNAKITLTRNDNLVSALALDKATENLSSKEIFTGGSNDELKCVPKHWPATDAETDSVTGTWAGPCTEELSKAEGLSTEAKMEL
jgi:hypothetical protein